MLRETREIFWRAVFFALWCTAWDAEVANEAISYYPY